jgi:hypothetical protein
MQSKTFVQTFVCRAQLLVKFLGAMQDFCSNMLDANKNFCSNFGCKVRILFAHFWYKATSYSNIFGAKSDFCSTILNAKQDICLNICVQSNTFIQSFWRNARPLFKHIGCKARLLFNYYWGKRKPIVQTLSVQSKTFIEAFEVQTLRKNLFENVGTKGLRNFCSDILG